MKTQSEMTKDKAPHNQAVTLLKSNRFFNELLKALDRGGLVGEQQNALALFVIGVSRLMTRPLNAFIKARSSAGKNLLVKSVLRLFPRRCYVEITSASEKSWNYAGTSLQHKIVYLQERNERSEAVHPVRLLVSENRLVRTVTERVNGEFTTKTYVTEGPISALSTTTKAQLTIDDENRHISIWVDESPDQTKRIAKGYLTPKTPLSKQERRVWYKVQRLLETRAANAKIVFPNWFPAIVDHIPDVGIRLRRYFPFLVEAVRTVALIRSFQRNLEDPDRIRVSFADLAITAIIFDRVFVETLRRRDDHGIETRQVVERLHKQHNRSVKADDVADALHIPLHAAYRRLRNAARNGLIQRANAPQKANVKLYLPAVMRFLPEPGELYKKLGIQEEVHFVHPLTGESVLYTRKSRHSD